MIDDYMTTEGGSSSLVRFTMNREGFVAHLHAREAYYVAEAEDLASKAEAAKGKSGPDPAFLDLIDGGVRNTIALHHRGIEAIMEIAAHKIKRLQSKGKSFAFFANHLAPVNPVTMSLDDLVTYELVDPDHSTYRSSAYLGSAG